MWQAAGAAAVRGALGKEGDGGGWRWQQLRYGARARAEATAGHVLSQSPTDSLLLPTVARRLFSGWSRTGTAAVGRLRSRCGPSGESAGRSRERRTTLLGADAVKKPAAAASIDHQHRYTCRPGRTFLGFSLGSPSIRYYTPGGWCGTPADDHILAACSAMDLAAI
jgi:hypothetical protein